MANTYNLINSNVLSTSTATVTFSEIPATYTDLVLRVSIRGTAAADGTTVLVRLNGNTTSIYSQTYLIGNGSSAYSSRAQGTDFTGQDYVLLETGSTATVNTFSSGEIYYPSYTANQSKVSRTFVVTEKNAANADQVAAANLFRSNSAISVMRIYPYSGSFEAGSSFYLYGIKNS
jgi:hypothetical protein